jgi:hypothetical protein
MICAQNSWVETQKMSDYRYQWEPATTLHRNSSVMSESVMADAPERSKPRPMLHEAGFNKDSVYAQGNQCVCMHYQRNMCLH